MLRDSVLLTSTLTSVADLEGAEPALVFPPPLGDGLTLMQNFNRSTVKHGTQNIQNDRHLSDSFRLHQIRFRPVLRPGPHRGSLQRLQEGKRKG